jgi:hypothetical protein
MAGDPYEFIRWAGWKSEEVAETFTGDPDQIQELVDNHELVLAVWKDDQYPEADGYNVLIIKGRPRFIAGHFDTSGSWTAIPCTGPDRPKRSNCALGLASEWAPRTPMIYLRALRATTRRAAPAACGLSSGAYCFCGNDGPQPVDGAYRL